MSVEYGPGTLGTGSYLPEIVASGEDAAQIVVDYSREELKKRDLTESRIDEILEIRKRAVIEIGEQVGIKNRHYCSERESTSTMGIEAGHKALESAHVTANEIKGVILSTGMGDFIGTSTAAIIAKELGVPEKVMTHDISAACPGFAHAAYEACTNLTSPIGLDGPILVIASEPISRGMHPAQKGTIPIFGDGAGAMIIGLIEIPSSKLRPWFQFGALAEFLNKLQIRVGGSVYPLTPKTPDKDKGIHMDNKFTFRMATTKMVEYGKDAIEEAQRRSIPRLKLAPHQANILIIDEAQYELGFKDEDVIVNISNVGNTGSASIPIAIDQAIRSGELVEGDTVIGDTFGSGFLVASFMLHMRGLGDKWVHYPSEAMLPKTQE